MRVNIQQQISLKSLNTMAVDATAESYCKIISTADLASLFHTQRPALILGGGSNILFVKPVVEGLVLHPDMKGIDSSVYDDDHMLVTAQAGENWHDFVQWCVTQGYGGLENLSLIPGNVGAAPIQNIGAYGVEVKDRIHQVEALNIDSGGIRKFTASECCFAYRDSLFKSEQKGKWLILSVEFLLTRKQHQINTSYGVIQQTLQQQGIDNPGIQDVANAVIQIRQQRLPDPGLIPNTGSFFKNPIVNAELVDELRAKYRDIPVYEMPDNQFKLAAGWLIEQCGWRGHRREGCGVHDEHALVLINHNGASGEEIYQLSEDIIASVEDRFDVSLQREVNII